MTTGPARDPWARALDYYGSIGGAVGQFNVALLDALRPRWASRVRPDTSMLDLLFTRPDSTGYVYDERVEVAYEGEDRVRVALRRMVPRRGETRPAGPVVIAGDYVRPEHAVPVVESFLMQLE